MASLCFISFNTFKLLLLLFFQIKILSIFAICGWRCSVKQGFLKKFRNIHRRTPVLESLFNKVACNFIKKRLQHKCFPVSIAKFFKTPILMNIYKQLLLCTWPLLLLTKKKRWRINNVSMKLEFILKYIMCYVIIKNLMWTVKKKLISVLTDISLK